MKTLFRLLLCLFFSAAFQIPSYGQPELKTYDSLLSTIFPKDGPGGTVLISKAGKVLFNKAYGKANLELNVPMRTEHVFRLGSITKQFTAVCILKLLEEGKLSLEDELIKFIPDYPLNGKKITIANLLTHTSGIKNYTALSTFNENLKRQDRSPKELIDLFKDQPLDFEPGSDYKYSNSGYILLGYIIEKLSGKSYGEYVQKNIFEPLQMSNSYYDERSKVISERISGYRKRNGSYENSDFLSMTLPYAAGSLLSTTGDLLKWYNGLEDGKVISRASLELAHTSGRLANGKETGYGFGWEIGNIQGSKAIKHNGIVNGFFTDVIYLPTEEIFVSILANYENIGDLDIAVAKLAAIALDRPYIFNTKVIESTGLQQYQAVYSNPYEGERFITNQDGILMYYHKGGGKTRLIPYGTDIFLLENSLNSLMFQRDDKGTINGYQIKGTGATSIWKKSKEIPLINRINISSQVLNRYTGKYLFEPNMLFEVVLENGKLFGRVGNDQKELTPFEENKFYANDIDATVIFNLDKSGQTISVTKIQNSEMRAKKL
ncbi:serine hydrolase [Pedobacter sp.]